MGKISFFNQDISNLRLKKKVAGNHVADLIIEEGKQIGEISVIFCSDSYLLSMNREYLNHDYLTDVITFDYRDGDIISGDIFISVDRVKENASIYGENFHNELFRVIFHGTLHLIGYGDKTDEEKPIMRNKENYYLGKYIK